MSGKNINRSGSESAVYSLPVVALAGFLISLLLMAGLVLFLLSRKLIPWPFHGADTVSGTYYQILVYLPVTCFALVSVWWVGGAKQLFKDFLAWRRFSPTFFLGLALSAGYTLVLYLTNDFALKGISFVPPALLMGFLNAVSEEILFRLVLFRLLTECTGSWLWANLLQAAAYGIVHLFIGGPVFFLYAAGYGLLLGWMTRTNESIVPAVICHFVADIGAIGLPLLILM